MSTTRWVFAATRDIIGGGLGGLMATWVITDMHRVAIMITGLVLVFGLATVYWIFHWIIGIEEKNHTQQSQQEESNRPEPRWPPYRAS